LILRIILGVFLFAGTPLQVYADCADLMADLAELEVGMMRKSAFEIRKVLDHPDLSKLDPIINFVEARFHDEALDSIPLVIPALLMHPDVTRQQLEKIMSWIQHAEHFYLLRARDDIVEANRQDRFFIVLMNINKLREPIEISKQVQFVEDMEAAEVKVGDQSIQDWLGLRYLHLNRILLNREVKGVTGWALLKKDLFHGMDPDSLMLVRYFLKMAQLNFEMLEDERLWPFSAFAKLPEKGVPPVLGEDDPTPSILDNDSHQRYFDILLERYPAEADEEDGDEDDDSESWKGDQTPEPDARDTYDLKQAELLHILVQALIYDGSDEETGKSADDVDVPDDFQEVLNDWELAGGTLNAPTIIDDQTSYMLTPVQSAYFWDRMPQKDAILKAIAERKLPFWLLPPCESGDRN